ncbi:OmpA family protein [Parahaliea maris]|nr:OmpA family protein [Parahaliea maris]
MKHLAAVRLLTATGALLVTLAGCSNLDLPRGGQADSRSTSSATTSRPAEPRLASASSDAEVASQLARATAQADKALPDDTVGYYLDVQTAKLQTLQHGGLQVRREADHIRLVLPGSGSFDTGSASLTPAIQTTLDELASLLREYDLSLVLIAGHSDNQGDPNYNLQLSRERARAVGRYLNRHGVDTQRLVVRGFGDSHPVADNATEEGRTANRRIELELWPLVATNRGPGAS